MATPFNPDALTRLPRVPPPRMPPADHDGPATVARTLRPRPTPVYRDGVTTVLSVEEFDPLPWYALNWIHAAFLARQAMEQAFAAFRGDES